MYIKYFTQGIDEMFIYSLKKVIVVQLVDGLPWVHP